jgi:hypothetical protein
MIKNDANQNKRCFFSASVGQTVAVFDWNVYVLRTVQYRIMTAKASEIIKKTLFD